ncbi:MAG: copper resistance protein CopC [Euryarchaeota archaeon]|nr:copper resistance protein CopC [Euryarchaeota archaeon]
MNAPVAAGKTLPRPASGHRKRRYAFGTLVLFALLLALPLASAHADYVRSEPAKSARLEAPPNEVTVWLSERVDPSASWLRVFDEDGERVDDGDTEVENRDKGSRLSVGLDGIGPGAYTVNWDTVSKVDGHTNPGKFGFAVGDALPPETIEEKESLEPVSATARALSYAGFSAAFGALAFLLYILPRSGTGWAEQRLSALLPIAAVLHLVGVLWLFFDTVGRTELSAVAFMTTTGVGMTFQWRFTVGALALIASAAAYVHPPSRGPMLYVALGSFLIAGWFSASLGHASQEGTWAVALDFLHLVGAATWVGGLAGFLVYLATTSRKVEPSEVRAVGMAFSAVAIVAVVLLTASGVATGLVILGTVALRDPLGVVKDPYGAFLAGKIVVALLMVGLAAVNRYIFIGRFPGRDKVAEKEPERFPRAWPQRMGDTPRVSSFKGSVAVETFLGVSVLVLAGFLTALSPPGPDSAGEEADIFRAVEEGSDFLVVFRLEPAPTAPGESRLVMNITDTRSGEPLEDAIRVVVESEQQGREDLGAERFEANMTSPGTWAVDRVVFVSPGNYTFTVTIDTPYVYHDTVMFEVPVAAREG